MITTLALGVALASPPPANDDDLRSAADAIQVNAYLMASELTPGERYEIAIEVALADGLSLADSGIPAPMLQIEVPASVKLTGRVLTTYQELAENEFVAEPWERMLEELPARVSFELLSAPKGDETIGLNIIGYVRGANGEHSFLRRRLELALEPGAAALEVPASTSRWGDDAKLLHIGDRAADFTLPRADGSELSLSHYLGEKKVVILTYRAHW